MTSSTAHFNNLFEFQSSRTTVARPRKAEDPQSRWPVPQRCASRMCRPTLPAPSPPGRAIRHGDEFTCEQRGALMRRVLSDRCHRCGASCPLRLRPGAHPTPCRNGQYVTVTNCAALQGNRRSAARPRQIDPSQYAERAVQVRDYEISAATIDAASPRAVAPTAPIGSPSAELGNH